MATLLMCPGGSHFVRPSRAAAQPGPEGSRIANSDYSIDLFRGPALGTSRMVGLGGANVALAEGVEGGLRNPAAVANRPQQSVDWWDYWYGFGLTYPFDVEDFYNSGGEVNEEEVGTVDFFFFNPGGYLQFYRLGFGVNLDLQSQRVTRRTEEGRRAVDVRLNSAGFHFQVGYALWKGQLVLGGGPLLMVYGIGAEGVEVTEEEARSWGLGGEAGFILRPTWAQWRIGASAFSPLSIDVEEGHAVIQTLTGDGRASFLPAEAKSPWRGSVGFAYQFGDRPLNPRFTYARREAKQELEIVHQDRALLEQRFAAEMRELESKDAGESEIRKLKAHRKAALAHLRWEEKRAIKEAWRRLRAQVRHYLPRRYLLVSTEVAFDGRVDDAVGVESFLAQRVQRSGERVSVSPRLGIEGEPWQRRMKLRAGVYMEPSRFRDRPARWHGTAGFDLRMVPWDVFGLWPEDQEWAGTFAVDLARGYQAFSVSLTGWY